MTLSFLFSKKKNPIFKGDTKSNMTSYLNYLLLGTIDHKVILAETWCFYCLDKARLSSMLSFLLLNEISHWAESWHLVLNSDQYTQSIFFCFTLQLHLHTCLEKFPRLMMINLQLSSVMAKSKFQ